MRSRPLIAIVCSLLGASVPFAQSPPLINYQGRLINGTNLLNGMVGLAFRMYTNELGGAHLFESTSRVSVIDGVYATRIGEHVTFGSLDEALSAPATWLEVRIDGMPLNPRERLVSVPYARNVHGLAVGQNHSIALTPESGITAATGLYSFAAGRLARAVHDGSFVWGDATGESVESTAADQVTFRAGGGFRVLGGAIKGDASGLTLSGQSLTATFYSATNPERFIREADLFSQLAPRLEWQLWLNSTNGFCARSPSGDIYADADLKTLLNLVLRSATNHFSIAFSPGLYPLRVDAVGNTTNYHKAGLLLNGRTNVTLRGPGAILQAADRDGDFIFINGSSHVAVEHLTFAGKGMNRPVVNALYAVINLNGSNDHITVNNCAFRDFGNHGISSLQSPKYSRDVQVIQNIFERGGTTLHPTLRNDGAAVSGAGVNWHICNNIIKNCIRGIEVEGSAGSVFRNIVISANTLEDIWDHGVLLMPTSADADDLTDVIISANAIRHIPSGATGNGVYIGGGRRILVANNAIAHAKGGISVHAFFSEIQDVVVSGNTVAGSIGKGVFVAAVTKPCDHATVIGNTVRGSTAGGILVSGVNLAIRNNFVSENAGYGIQAYVLHGGSSNISITANQVAYSTASAIAISTNVGAVFCGGENFMYGNLLDGIDDQRD